MPNKPERVGAQDHGKHTWNHVSPDQDLSGIKTDAEDGSRARGTGCGRKEPRAGKVQGESVSLLSENGIGLKRQTIVSVPSFSPSH